MTHHMSAKTIKSLHQKKHRKETNRFLVEGGKNVAELLASTYEIEGLYATKEFKAEHAGLLAKRKIEAHVVDAAELAAFGTLEHNDGALAVAVQKKPETPDTSAGITLVLDDIRDPGNMGTLIRIADWYGIANIVCSINCVDWYNPKVIAASMGSFTRVSGFYTDLASFLKKQSAPKLGADLRGTSVHAFAFPKNGILVIGSESHGISADVAKQLSGKITIPSFGKAESLNAAVAGAIILDRWKSGI